VANSVQNIPLNVMPQAQPAGPVVPNNNGVIDDSAAENAAMQTSNENRTHEADSQAAVENPNNNEAPVTEGKGDDFQDVLDRKLSNKSDDKQAAADSEKPQDGENKTGDKSEDGTQNLSGLISVNNQNITMIDDRATKVTPVVLLKGDKTAKPVTKNLITQQKIVEIPLQNALKDQAAAAQKGDLVAMTTAETTNTDKTAADSAAKAADLTKDAKDAMAKDAPEIVVKTDTTQLTDKTQTADNLSAGKLTAQEIAAAKQNANAAQNTNTDQTTDAKKATTENVDPTAAVKTTETIDKSLKMEVVTDATPKDTEVIDKPKITDGLQVETKTETNAAGETQEQALNEQNAKTEKKKASASVDFNYTRAQNDTAVSNTATDAPAGSTTQTNTVNAVSGVQSTAAASRTDGLAQPQSPAQQIIDAARAPDVSPSSQINLTLNPDQLGRVRISFQQENGEITGMIEVEKAQTRYDIEKDIPQIVASLQDSGMQVKKIDVVQDNNPEPDRQKSELTDQFEQANKRSFAEDGSSNQRQGSPAPSNRGSQVGADYQQAKEAVSHISDDAISAYA
jgi:flagellar hook-length control protein FliK